MKPTGLLNGRRPNTVLRQLSTFLASGAGLLLRFSNTSHEPWPVGTRDMEAHCYEFTWDEMDDRTRLGLAGLYYPLRYFSTFSKHFN